MNRKIVKTALLSLIGLMLLLSCNLDGEGAFYSIATAKEITTGSGYAQINKVLREDSGDYYVQAGNRISYKNTTDEDFTDETLSSDIKSISDIIHVGTDYYIMTVDGDDAELYSLDEDTTATATSVSTTGTNLLMLLTDGAAPYSLNTSTGSFTLNKLSDTTAQTVSLSSGEQVTSNGTFVTTDTTHFFVNVIDSDGDYMLYHSDDDFVTSAAISAGDTRIVGGIELVGGPMYLYGYNAGTFNIYNFSTSSDLSDVVVSLEVDPPDYRKGNIPTVLVNSNAILVYLADDYLLEFKPTDETLAFASGYGLEDEKILDFYRIADNEFLTATNGSGLLYTLSKDTDGF